MSVANVDTSALVAIAFNERGAAALARRLDAFSRLLSSNLLDAGCIHARGTPIYTKSRDRVGPAGSATDLRVRDAPGWLFAISRRPSILSEPGDMFVTLDDRQRTVATALGFQV